MRIGPSVGDGEGGTAAALLAKTIIDKIIDDTKEKQRIKQRKKDLKQMRREIDVKYVFPELGQRPLSYGFSQKIWDTKRIVLQTLYLKMQYAPLPSSSVNTRNEFKEFIEPQQKYVLDELALQFLEEDEEKRQREELNTWFQEKLDRWPKEEM